MKRTTILLLISLSLSANAGWLKNFCERHFTQERTYSQVPREQLEAQVKRWEIREAFWGPLGLTYNQRVELTAMREELQRRDEEGQND